MSDIVELYLGTLKVVAEVTDQRDALADALEDLLDVQLYATGWSNGVTDSTGTIDEGAVWHSRAMDRAISALKAVRG